MSEVRVYWSAPYWRIGYAGTTLRLTDDRAEAVQCGRTYAEHLQQPLEIVPKGEDPWRVSERE